MLRNCRHFALYLLLCPALCAAGEFISLTPGVSEMFLAAGAANALSGRSSACLDPALKHIPVAGDLATPHVETILRLRPRAVITDAAAPGGHWQLLRHLQIPVIRLSNDKLDDFPANLRKIGELANCRDAAAKAAAEYEKAIAKLRSTRPPENIPVLILCAANAPVTCGAESFISEAVLLAGGQNIASSRRRGYFTVSPEALLRHRPLVIICIGVPPEAARAVFSRAIFRHLPAIRNNLICTINADRFCRNNINLPAEIAGLRKVLHSAAAHNND